MKNIEEKTNGKGDYRLNEQIYKRFGILGNPAPVCYGGLGSGAAEMSALVVLRRYACLNEEDSKKLFSIENKLKIQNEPLKNRRKSLGVDIVESYFFDEQKNLGIIFNKMEQIDQNKTYFAYGFPSVFTINKDEFQRLKNLAKKINKIKSSCFIIQLFNFRKLFSLFDEHSEILKNEQINERAVDYLLEQYSEKPMEK